ncbi:MAG: hypothetical protein WAW96_21260, partial [Alphaproteobacteria bacterium]
QNCCGLLDLREASARSFAEDTTIWAQEGPLPIQFRRRRNVTFRLDGFTYERLTDLYESANAKRRRTPVDWSTRIAWLKAQAKEDLNENFRPQPWVHCAKVLRAMGHDWAALRIAEARERYRLFHTPSNPITWVLRLLFWVFTGFGQAYWRAVGFAVLIISLGTFIYQKAYDTDVLIHDPNMSLTAPTERTADASRSQAAKGDAVYPAFNCVLYSLDTFLPVINLRQKEYWVPGDNPAAPIRQRPHHSGIVAALSVLRGWISKPKSFGDDLRNVDVRFPELTPSAQLVWLWTWFEIAAGWTFTTILAAGFTGLLDRKE